MSGKPISQWLADLESADKAPQALAGLWSLDPTDADALPPLLERFQENHPPTGDLAIRFLGLLGPAAAPAVPHLRARLRDDASRPCWRFCADTLGFIGPAAREALPELEALLRSDEPWERALAAGAILKLRPEDPGPLEELDRTRQGTDIPLQCFAILRLLEVVRECPEALAYSLRWLAEEYDPHIEDLRDHLPYVSGRAQPLLIEAVGSADPVIRGNAAIVLSRQTADPAQVVAALAGALSDPAERVRWRAAGALLVQSESGADLRPVLPVLRQVERDGGGDVQDVVRAILARL